MNKKSKVLLLSLAIFTVNAGQALAEVSAEEAAKLGEELTPYGAIRAGNEDGSIPAWTGGMVKPPAAYEGEGTTRIDPFADEKPLFTIDASNYNEYADNLSAGQKKMFETFPDTYKMPVYETHRTAAAPEWVYDNISKNAVNATLTKDGNGVTGAYGGIAFPIPQNGTEAIWNHNLRWIGLATFKDFVAKTVYPNNSVDVSGAKQWEKYPYYKEGEYNPEYNGSLLKFLIEYTAPVRRKGELFVVQEPLDIAESPRQSWQYIPGQRRIRRAPTVAFDTPNPTANGKLTYDDVYMFNGSPERYNWTLLGKKEMYVPYNNNKWIAHAEGGDEAHSDLLTPDHLNPEFERFEKHRVWVVEAKLKEDKRHIYGKRVFYLDEDTWNIVLADNFDGKDNLWRSAQAHLLNAYDVPATVLRSYVFYDFQDPSYYVAEMDTKPIKFYEGESSSFFTPAQLRKKSRR